ncbi:MAG: imidazole glycerol phosphate synthase subunit HisH, partial [Bacteroidales bacterium]|nr:imidazole glycerol phosphate synthase subunit HisH [Bacteroidales bacterium]
VLPGVGDASCAMAALRDCGLSEFIPSLTQPVLGICVGLQLMCRRSEEGDVKCMGIFDTDVVRFQPADGLKIPHMGWNAIGDLKTRLFKDLKEDSYVYYVHSFYPQLCGDTIATTTHGVAFSGALARNNFYGTQFHPEKSGEVGAVIIKNFLGL